MFTNTVLRKLLPALFLAVAVLSVPAVAAAGAGHNPHDGGMLSVHGSHWAERSHYGRHDSGHRWGQGADHGHSRHGDSFRHRGHNDRGLGHQHQFSPRHHHSGPTFIFKGHL